MRFANAAALLSLVPMTAQAVVVVQYDGIEMRCRSIQLCNARVECVSDTSFETTVRLKEDTYMGSFSPFAQRREKWTRALSYDELGTSGSPKSSTYRTLAKAQDVASTYRKANTEERQDGWFGPELPDLNQPQSQAITDFTLYHTRSLQPAKTGLFQSPDRQVIVFECERTK